MKPFIILVLSIVSCTLLFPQRLSTAQTFSSANKFVEKDSKTFMGRDIPILSISAGGDASSDNAKHRFLIIGGTHGDEVLTSEFVVWLYKRTATGKGRLARFGNDVSFDFIPALNIDSYSKRRNNANGVNLNRNYSINWGESSEHFGLKPFSESETKLVQSLYSKFNYTAAVDVHGYTEWVVAQSKPITMVEKVNKENFYKYREWFNSLRDNLYKLPGGDYQLVTDMSLEDGGAFEDWSFWQMNTPAFCLEMSSEYKKEEHEKLYFKYESYLYSMFKKAADLERLAH